MNKKIALVTGGSRGIGRAIVETLFQNDFDVAINYRTSKNEALTLANKLNSQNQTNRAITVCADVSSSAAVSAMFQTIRAELGDVTLLVNNAGIAKQALFTCTTESDWDNLFGTNVKGMFLCAKEALPSMITKKSGKIINISSMWGEVGASCEVAYSASKSAVIGLTKALAKEVGPSGILVNCIAPGVITTEMNQHLSANDISLLCEETPLGVLGTADDIAKAVLFFSSDHANFITGQILGVNGGIVI